MTEPNLEFEDAIRRRWYGKQTDDAKAITYLLDRMRVLQFQLTRALTGKPE